jgi:uncharacterized protein YecE (DUF72 family)
LYPAGTKSGEKLQVYGTHFPLVEVDSSFYAVQSQRNYEKWVGATADGFSFIIKAYQAMTGHLRGKNPFESTDAMFDAFKQSIQPVIEAGKMKAVLFQYPPWFNCTRENVETLREVKARMGGIPLALEFRNQSWFTPDMTDKTLAFMAEEGWFHCICDEPQAGAGSVPIVLRAANPDLTVVRLHGRNVQGWNQSSNANWREVRYLYNYSREELMEWADMLRELEKSTKEILVVFNNNSGGDAAGNAKEMMALLGLRYEADQPQQMDLFLP